MIISVYLFSFIWQLCSFVLLLINPRNDTLFKLIVYLVYYSRKIHIVIMNMVILSLSFFGLRIVLHADYYSLSGMDGYKYLILLVGILFLLCDVNRILKVSFTLGNLMAFNKNKNSDRDTQTKDLFFEEKKRPIRNKKQNKVNDVVQKRETPKRVLDRETTLYMLKINHPIRDYLINSINGPNEIFADQIFYTSSSQFLKLVTFSMSIIALQNLPVLNLMVLFLVESTVLITNIAAMI